jgi:hypothetical protein
VKAVQLKLTSIEKGIFHYFILSFCEMGPCSPLMQQSNALNMEAVSKRPHRYVSDSKKKICLTIYNHEEYRRSSTAAPALDHLQPK